MTLPAPSPPIPSAPAKPASGAAASRRRLSFPRFSRRAGCLAVWLLFLAPALFSLLPVFLPRLREWLAQTFAPPHPLQRWLEPGPALTLKEWLANVDPGPTMVYLIFAAVLVLFSVAVFVRDEPQPQ